MAKPQDFKKGKDARRGRGGARKNAGRKKLPKTIAAEKAEEWLDRGYEYATRKLMQMAQSKKTPAGTVAGICIYLIDRRKGKPKLAVKLDGELNGNGLLPVLVLPLRDKGERGKVSDV
jgi:acetyl-CoA carboxylase carboxyltransferase component